MVMLGVDAPLTIPLICGIAAATMAVGAVLAKNTRSSSKARRQVGWTRKTRWQAPTGGYFVAYYDGSNSMTRMQVRAAASPPVQHREVKILLSFAVPVD